MSLFSRFYGTLFKLLCWVNQSLVLRDFCNVTLNSISRGPSHIADVKIYEIFQERINNWVLFLQIYCPSFCNLHSTADVPLKFFRKFSEHNFLRASLLLPTQSLLEAFRFRNVIVQLINIDDYKLTYQLHAQNLCCKTLVCWKVEESI